LGMKKGFLNIALPLLLTLTSNLSSYSQYLGGIEDGYSTDKLTSLTCPPPTYPAMFLGGIEDGYSFDKLTPLTCPPPTYPAMFLGGVEDGNSLNSLTLITCPGPVYPAMFLGGIEDGYSTNGLTQLTCPAPTYPALYLGGIEDGNSFSSLTQATCPAPVYPAMYLGGIEDGHGFKKVFDDCAPVVDFSGTPLTLCPTSSVTYTDLTAPVPASWSWIFEGGTPATSTTQNPVITYNTPGTYDVTLYATDNFGTGVMIKADYITVGNQSTATITPDGPTTFCPGDSVHLAASAGTTWLWSPGGETTQTITVIDSGSYTVTVDGCLVPASSTTIALFPDPIRPEINSPGFINSEIILTSTSSTSYLWSPGSETTQAITVAATGDHDVITTDANGCVDTSSLARIKITAAGCNAVLPIELLFFDFEITENNWVHLKWTTSSESNNAFFTVERSKDLVVFQELATVAGAGNSNVLNNYSVYDKEPFYGLTYYRLKQTDYDGKIAHPGFILVFLFPNSIALSSLFPNPANDIVSYTVTNELDDASLEVDIIDVFGRTIISQTSSLKKGVSKITINVKDLSSGLYSLVARISDNRNNSVEKSIVEKFVKD